ncbi:MAG: hypothetical protein IT426_10685 [Pirellulales bacterium]|nr:hypothetical protein [Pirellulales bacterium]
MRQRIQLAVVGFCILVNTVFSVSDVRAGKPIPAGKNAPTEASWRAELYARHQQDIAAYKKLSQDPQAIQAETAQFLDGYFKKAYYMPQAPSWEELGKRGDQLSARGAKDPFFVAIVGLAKARMGKTKESVPLMTSACQAMEANRYPASIRFMACANWYLQAASNRALKNEAQAAMQAIVPAFLQVAEETADNPQEQKFVWDAVSELIFPGGVKKSPVGMAVQPAIFEAAEKAEKIHPWLKHMLLGYKYAFVGWEHRGEGFINTVTPENRRKFLENMEKAADHFTKAWELDPKVPYVAEAMIAVAGSSGVGGRSAREWFDRAVAARMDYYWAYPAVVNYLQPKWGGSYPEVRQFLADCAATKRYDTDVPFKFILYLHFLDADFGNRGEIWLEEGVYETAKVILEGMEQEPNRSAESLERRPPDWILSLHGALAARVRKYDEARKIFDRLGEKFQKDVFQFINCTDPIEVARVYAMTGGGRAEVVKLEDLFADGDLGTTEKLKSARELLEKAVQAAKEPLAEPYFNQRKTALDWQEKFHRGDWIDLNFDEHFSMWERCSGKWTFADSQSVISHEMPFGKPNRLVLTVPLPGPLEVELDIAGLDYSRGYQCGIGIGNTWERSGQTGGCMFWFSPRWRLSGVSVPGNNHNVFKELEYEAHFRIQAWDGAFCFYPHSTEHPPVAFPGMTLGSHLELNTSGINGEMAGSARFSNIRVRKLTTPPPPMGENADRVGYFDKLIEKNPKNGFLYYQRGESRSAIGQFEAASADFQKAIKLDPGFAMPHLTWSQAAYKLGNVKLAMEQLDAYLKLVPDDWYANDGKAVFLATCEDKKYRNGKLAVQIAKKLCEKSKNRSYTSCATLACAYAECGDFANAVKWAKEAAHLAPPPKKKQHESRVELFQSKRPLRYPVPKPKNQSSGNDT